MVRGLKSPSRPLRGGRRWTWHGVLGPSGSVDADQTWWFRIFHHGRHSPTPGTRRSHGPLYRFDHHTVADPPAAPRHCPDGRTIIYLARTLGTALAEKYGDLNRAAVCPGARLAALRIDSPCRVQDLTDDGCMGIGALPALCTGKVPRKLSQDWARAIYEDEPAGSPIVGLRYRSAHDEGLCLALFERSSELVEVTGPDMPAGGQSLLAIRDRVGIELAERGIRLDTIDTKACRNCP